MTPTTVTGVFESAVVPSPSSPTALTPQHWTEPVLSTAQVCSKPTATITASVMPDTVTGVDELMRVPSPS